VATEITPAAVEELLAHFLIGALGLNLDTAIREVCHLPARKRTATICRTSHADIDASVCAAWRTDKGIVSVCGAYDRARSQRMGAHVVYIEWWIAPDTHYEGWWYCCIKRPREWTVGRGRHTEAP
jgi:hypothetical protein